MAAARVVFGSGELAHVLKFKSSVCLNYGIVPLFLGIVLLAPGNARATDKFNLRLNNQTIVMWRTADLEAAKKAAAAALKRIAWGSSATKMINGRGTISADTLRGAALHALYAYRSQTALIFEEAYEENH